MRAFNGDPHPGNYLFHRGRKVTFLDFGFVTHLTPAELQPLMQMARTICVEHDPEAFRRSLENAGFLRPGTPLSTQAIVEHLAVFYDTIREPGPLTITSDYASSVVRRFFDLLSPVAGYIAVPRSYVILQRINLGLFAVLGELSATANWRAIAEEIWPFMQWIPWPVNTAMNCAVRPDSRRDPGAAGCRPPGAGVMHVALAGFILLNRPSLLCVLVDESETNAARVRHQARGTARQQEDTDV